MSDVGGFSTLSDITSVEELLRLSRDGELKRIAGVSDEGIEIGLEIAEWYISNGLYSKACALYDMLTLLKPYSFDILSGYCYCLHKAGKNTVALHGASEMIKTCPDDPRGYFLSGCVNLAIRRVEDACSFFTKASALAKEDGDFVHIVEESERILSAISDKVHLSEVAVN